MSDGGDEKSSKSKMMNEKLNKRYYIRITFQHAYRYIVASLIYVYHLYINFIIFHFFSFLNIFAQSDER